MSNVGTTVAKVVLLASGAVLGAILARICDDLLTSHSQEQSEYDKTRYAQGLGPIPQQPKTPPQAPFQAPIDDYQSQE